MRKNKDLTGFKKLSEERQNEIIEIFIKNLPKEKQKEVRKDLLGK